MSGNNWHCDCNISQLQAVLLSPSSKVSDPATVTCQTPPDLSNTPVNSLNLYDNPLCFTSKEGEREGERDGLLFFNVNHCFYLLIMNNVSIKMCVINIIHC